MSTIKRFDWFLTGMIVAVLLAWFFPEPGADGGSLHPELLTNLGVAIIFFLHGVGLSFTALKNGILQWQRHLLVQSCVFLLFPAIGVLMLLLLPESVPNELRIGLFFLCALPSTVSTSVALTSTAYGNVPIALFSATASSLLGVVLTPLWMSGVVKSSGEGGAFLGIVVSLCFLLVLPLVIGQIARRWLGDWGSRNKKLINTADRIIILFLIYTSFCDSFAMGVWSNSGVGVVGLTFLISLVLFYVVFVLIKVLCKLLNLSREDQVAVLFCGSKKSLATGIPMSQVMFAGDPGLGLILLPILIYHPLQLVICGVLAGRWAKEFEEQQTMSERDVP